MRETRPCPAGDRIVDGHSGARRRDGWASAGRFVVGVAAAQVALLVVVVHLTGGREFTSDAPMLMGFARHPLSVLSGRTATYGQHPPFLGLLIASFAVPARRFLPDMVALRLGFVAWTAVGLAFASAALRAALSVQRRRRVLAAIAVSPTCWYTPVIASQDEVIAAAFVAAVLWLVVRRRWTAALVVCGVGVVAAKVFLAIPLVLLVVLAPHRSLARRAVLGLGPVVVTYAWVVAAALERHQPPPLLAFDPNPAFGINGWTLAVYHSHAVRLEAARAASELLVAVVVAVLVGVVAARRLDPTPARLWVLTVAGLLWAWVAFYHVDPEYYVLTNAALIAVAFAAPNSSLKVATAALTVLPWTTRIFYEAGIPAGRVGEKARITRIVDRLTPGSVHVWYLASLITCAATTVVAAALTTRAALCRDPGPSPQLETPVRRAHRS